MTGIAIIGGSLGPGGAERVMATLANRWCETERVVLITVAGTDGDFYRVSSRVKRIGLGLTDESRGFLSGLLANIARVRALARVLDEERIDVAIGFVTHANILTICACRIAGSLAVVAERIDPRAHREASIWRVMRRLCYPWADAVVAQTESVASWMAGRYAGSSRIFVIPNPVCPPGVETDGDEVTLPHDVPFVVAMGRLTHQKGFDLLLRAFAAIRSGRDEALVIIGEGPERVPLIELATQLKIADRVRLVGRVSEPSALIRKARMFVLSSRYEGFPNALLEAMAAGVPVVAFACPSGPSEIIIHEINGLLVEAENVEALATAMNRLLDDEALRDRLGTAAAGVIERYSVGHVLGQWQYVVDRVRAPG